MCRNVELNVERKLQTLCACALLCSQATHISVPAFCHARESLQSLCSLITGDALLYSMFRVEATPVECPFKGPLSFTYNRGHGECRSPVSSIDSCTEESRLLLRYQACPDVHGTESTGRQSICITVCVQGHTDSCGTSVVHTQVSLIYMKPILNF